MNDSKELDELKKAMPYTVPNEFFETMEEKLTTEIKPKKPKRCAVWIVIISTLAVTASLALVFLRPRLNKAEECSFDNVEMAFQPLSEKD